MIIFLLTPFDNWDVIILDQISAWCRLWKKACNFVFSRQKINK